MSKQESAKVTFTKPTDIDLQRLAVMARQAYEQRHLKNCIAITNALLLVDPEHAEARALQTLIRSDIRHDLDNARALLEDVHRKDNPLQYEKAAQIVLWRVFNVDPANEEASALLSSIKTPLSEMLSASAGKVAAAALETRLKPLLSPEGSTIGPPALAPGADSEMEMLADAPPIRTRSAAEEHPEPAVGLENLEQHHRPSIISPALLDEPAVETEQLPETSPILEEVQTGAAKRSWLRRGIPRTLIPIGVAAIAVIAGVVLRSKQPHVPPAAPKTVNTVVSWNDTRSVVSDVHDDAPMVFANGAYTVTTPANDLQMTPNPTLAADLVTPRPDIRPAAVPADQETASKHPATVAANKRMGKLAISSPTATDIYSGDKYLGSTPVTLELSQGTHTLEYRHEDQRKLVKHVVKANKTTMAMVTFEVAVQINARPWAQVFIEGNQRRALGQTPLGSVQVPIGSVLVFENPNFPAKNYRVTGKETAIQIVFP